MLCNCGYFTEPDDQLRITEEFKELSNPLLEFAKEVHIDDFISNELLYVQYKNWCEESGHKSLARNSFLKRIAKAFTEYREDIVPTRTTRARGYSPNNDG
jgi:phage/plasmid-associated DNA primase